MNSKQGQDLKDFPSAVSRFVDTTELLESVFKLLPLNDLRKTITVSRQWLDVSLDVLWREVDSVSNLCRGLAPIVWDEYGWRFTRDLQQSDWDRFDSIYASRVRTLRNMTTHGGKLIDQLALTRPRFAILPNLQSLYWNGLLLPCITFVHAVLKNLSPPFLIISHLNISTSLNNTSVPASPTCNASS